MGNQVVEDEIVVVQEAESHFRMGKSLRSFFWGTAMRLLTTRL